MMQLLPLSPGVPEDSAPDGEAAEEVFDLTLDVEPYLPDAIVPAWSFLQDYPVLLVVLMFLLGYLIGKALQWLVRTVLNQAARKTATDVDDRIINYVTAPIVQTTVILSLVAAEKAFGFSEGVDWFLVRMLFSLLIYFWGRAWFKAITLSISAMSGVESRFELLKPRTRPLLEMGIKVILLSILIWMFMALWDIDGTAWLASAGVIGIAVGFAARDTLANLISGVSIIADAPYKIGDYIILDTGERGVVTELGMRSTRLLTRDDVEISIPNAVMGNAKITNESGGPAVEHRIRVPIGVAYGTEPARVVEVLEKVANDNSMILDRPAPRVRMREFAESSINFEVLGWIHLPEQKGLVRHKLLMEIEQAFREHGIQIPFPQRDVHLKTEGGTVSPAD
jgi:small-conductance mechanosensitive channel